MLCCSVRGVCQIAGADAHIHRNEVHHVQPSHGASAWRCNRQPRNIRRAPKFHLSKIASGQSYAQVSTAALAAPTNATLATEKATLFQGETLRGLLLGAWGWSVVGTIATIAGLILILLGGVLFLLPLANWQVNLRGRPALTGA